MPDRSFAAVASFNTGMVLAGGWDANAAVMGTITIILTYSAGAVYNCIKDVDGDKINQNDSPLSDMRLGIGAARWIMLAYVCLSFIFAALTSPLMLVSNAIGVVLGIVYSKYTKSILIMSYITLVTTHLVLPVVTGYLIFSGFHPFIMVIAVFFYISEVFSISIKDFKDVEGDRKMGVRTLPVVFSPECASKITFAGMCLPVVLIWFPWFIFKLSIVFLLIALSASAMKIMLGYALMKDPKRDTAKKVLGYFRYIMIIQIFSWCFV